VSAVLACLQINTFAMFRADHRTRRMVYDKNGDPVNEKSAAAGAKKEKKTKDLQKLVGVKDEKVAKKVKKLGAEKNKKTTKYLKKNTRKR